MSSVGPQVDVSGADVKKFNDAYFARPKTKATKSADGESMLWALVLVQSLCRKVTWCHVRNVTVLT